MEKSKIKNNTHNKKHAEFRQRQGEVQMSPEIRLMLTVRKKMVDNGELEGLSSDERLEKAIKVTERLLESSAE